MPFISLVFGYDVFNPAEVIPEFTAGVGVKRGEKIDYALAPSGQVSSFYEFYTDLDAPNKRHR